MSDQARQDAPDPLNKEIKSQQQEEKHKKEKKKKEKKRLSPQCRTGFMTLVAVCETVLVLQSGCGLLFGIKHGDPPPPLSAGGLLPGLDALAAGQLSLHLSARRTVLLLLLVVLLYL